MTNFCEELKLRTRELSRRLDGIGTPAGILAYNPLEYAWRAHARYLDLFAGPRRLVFIGMNPGPWGMLQTGVPFGDVENGRLILGLDGLDAEVPLVDKPHYEHKGRPVLGFGCKRAEESGRRFWSGLAPLWAHPADEQLPPARCRPLSDSEILAARIRRMLGDAFVMNVCPVGYFAADATDVEDGRILQGHSKAIVEAEITRRGKGRSPDPPNVTPNKLPKAWRDRIAGDRSPCAAYLMDVVRMLRPTALVVMGAWVEEQVTRWVGSTVRIVRLDHPSPASPKANKGWAALAQATMRDSGLAPVDPSWRANG